MQENGGGSLRHVTADNDLKHVKALLLVSDDESKSFESLNPLHWSLS